MIPELLAPAGGPEGVMAAVQSGADAIYMGYGSLNARRNAKNFTPDEVAHWVSYCHVRGCKVYLTLNTLSTDRELGQVAETVSHAASCGVDAIIIQDLGALSVIRQVAPNLAVHASTQMTVHSLDGVKRCADLGMERVVLSRELSRDALEFLCQHSPIELETFVHGALCMCYSGQCLFSSVLGGRSGNRGLCAQPCRLPFALDGGAMGHPLSLRDLSMASHLQELGEMGIACLKIEGRMKRPEYAAIVTSIYAAALKEGREPTGEELATLEAAFSRQGFTQGYFENRVDGKMFGTRKEGENQESLFAKTRREYQRGERPRVAVSWTATVAADQPVSLVLKDETGHQVAMTGEVPQRARTKALEAETVAAQLTKTGGTPFHVTDTQVEVEDGLSLPLSALNALRREGLDALANLRGQPPAYAPGGFVPPSGRPRREKRPPLWNFALRRAQQWSTQLQALSPHLVWLPVAEAAEHPEVVAGILESGALAGVVLPRICWDRERGQLHDQLERAAQLGCTQGLVGTLDLIDAAKEVGLTLWADLGLGSTNVMAPQTWKDLGFRAFTPSPELKLAQIRDMSTDLDMELLVYGRLPLMITEHCLVKSHAQTCTHGAVHTLVDRRGEDFPVLCAPGERSEVFNAKTLFLADKLPACLDVGARYARLSFTTEDSATCVAVAKCYIEGQPYEPKEFTRGLYFRDVE